MDLEREHQLWTATESKHGYIRARLRLLSTEGGGRATPMASGYRSLWEFPARVHEQLHDAPVTFEGTERWLAPGDEITVRLHPLVPEFWPATEPGLHLTMREGARVIGFAEVLELVSPAR